MFSHGWPLSSDAWDGQMFFLAQNGFRVVAHDRCGHGRSSQTSSGNDMNGYADDLAAVIEALDLKNIDDGETRLVARVDEVLPGEAISPSAAQVRGATLVVAHLRYAPLQSPEKDANTRQEIKATENQPENSRPIEF